MESRTLDEMKEQQSGIGKYDPDNLSFNDPIMRCCECSSLIMRVSLREKGCCPKCGCKRVRNVLGLTKTEMDACIEKGVDPEFIALWVADPDSDESSLIA